MALIGDILCSSHNESWRAEFEEEARRANMQVDYECRNARLYYLTATMNGNRVTTWNGGANCIEQIKD